MKAFELAYLNHLRTVYPGAFRGSFNNVFRKEDTVLEENRKDGLGDWLAGARWGAEHTDVSPDELVSVQEPHKNPLLNRTWAKWSPWL